MIETQKKTPSSASHIVCIEIKMAENWNRSWESTMRTLKNSEQIKVDRMIGVYTGQRTYHFNGLDVLPVDVFLKELYQGNIF